MNFIDKWKKFLLLMFLNIFYWLYYYSCPNPPPLPLCPSTKYPLSLGQFFLSSCPWVMHVSSLASPFFILFWISPCLCCTYHFVLFNPCTFSPILPLPSQLATIQIISISILLFLFCFLAQFVFQTQLLIVVNLLPF